MEWCILHCVSISSEYSYCDAVRSVVSIVVDACTSWSGQKGVSVSCRTCSRGSDYGCRVQRVKWEVRVIWVVRVISDRATLPSVTASLTSPAPTSSSVTSVAPCVSKQISKHFILQYLQGRTVEVIAILVLNHNGVKLSSETLKIPFHHPEFLSF